jgi:RNA polymerase sigma-70 factor, ECF subfamily
VTDERDAVREGLLVLRAQSGDRAALDELFARMQPALGRHLRHVVRDETIAEDALQEAFMLAHRNMRWLRDPLLFRPWLYRIASREAIRLARRQRARPEEALAERDYDTVRDPRRGGQLEDIMANQAMAAISAVSPASRAVLSLHYLEGYTLQESAGILGLSPGTVKSRLAAGLSQLRALLGLATGNRGGE